MTIAIIGSSGDIGSRLALQCIKQGDDVRLINRGSLGSVLGRYPFQNHQVDFIDPDKTLAALNNVSVVINCAINKNMKVSEKVRLADNLNLIDHLLQSASKAGVKRFIHLSSIAVLPPRLTAEVLAAPYSYSPETDWYTKAKVQTEERVRQYSGPMAVHIVRPGVVYGPNTAWSLVAGERVKASRIIIPDVAGVCHAIHIDDLCGLLRKMSTADQVPILTYGINPEKISWLDFYRQHAAASNVITEILSLPRSAIVAQSKALRRLPPLKQLVVWASQRPWILSLSGTPYFEGLKIRAKKIFGIPNLPTKRAPALQAAPCITETSSRPDLWPEIFDADLYSSTAIVTPDDSGHLSGYTYGVPFDQGVQGTGAWWQERLPALLPSEISTLEMLTTTNFQ